MFGLNRTCTTRYMYQEADTPLRFSLRSEQTMHLKRWCQKGSSGSIRGPAKQTAVMTN